jgi:hypothetical protein
VADAYLPFSLNIIISNFMDIRNNVSKRNPRIFRLDGKRLGF